MNHNVRLQVSHDGVNQTLTRHKSDWLQDSEKCELLKRYFSGSKRLGDFNVTYAPLGEPDLFHSLEYFREKLGKVFVCLRAPLRCDTTNAYLMADYSPKKIEIAKESMFRILTKDCEDDFVYMTSPTYHRLLELTRNFVYRRSPRSIDYNCPSKQRSAMHFDIHGNYIPCHGSSVNMKHGVGTIDDIKKCYDIGFTSVSNRPFCNDCIYTQICQGPCGMADNLNTLIHCKSMRWAYETWFSAIWFTLFGEKPIEITKV